MTTRDDSSGNTAAKEKKAVLNLLAAYRTGNAAALDVINPKKFIQHDPQVADGLSGLKAWLASLPQGQISVKPVRVLVDGPYVLVHSETILPSGPTVAWDVFRFEQGKIVEHWASRQPEHGPNPAGHTELDGPTAVTDHQATQRNKALAWTAMASILRDGDFSLFGEPLYNAAGYIQHSEGTTTDGTAHSKTVLQQFVESGTLVYTKIEKVRLPAGPARAAAGLTTRADHRTEDGLTTGRDPGDGRLGRRPTAPHGTDRGETGRADHLRGTAPQVGRRAHVSWINRRWRVLRSRNPSTRRGSLQRLTP